jgi:sigma-B regulation protein RsbU (phosphoserine phosphatase)
LGLAVAFAAVSTAYSVLWMYGVRVEDGTFLGIEGDFSERTAGIELRAVVEDSPARRSGLRAGDRILAVEGRPLASWSSLVEAITQRKPGDRLRLTVARPGAEAPFAVDVVLGRPPGSDAESLSVRVARQALASYPLLFLVVSVPLLLLRVEDRNAWLLALLFAGFIAAAPLVEFSVAPAFRGFTLAYKIAFQGLFPAVFLYLFSVFPAPSPVDRRFPWVKTLWLAAGVTVSLPLAAWALATGSRDPLTSFARSVVVPTRLPLLAYYNAGWALGLVSLTWNALRGPTAVKRKSRVIVWGTLLGFLPVQLLGAVATYLGRPPYSFPFWVWAPCILCLFLIPLSFAYAVVKHRVLEIPVLLRRSARYLLVQRGSVGFLLLAGVAATFSFALFFGRGLGPGMEPLGVALGAGFGSVLVWTGTQVQKRLRERIDRAFFRSAYDAREILQDLAEDARSATSRDDLAALLEHKLKNALLPRFLYLYLESRDGALRLVPGSVPPGCETLAADLSILVDLTRRGRPWDAPPPGSAASEALGPLAALEPDCLVPVLGRDGRMTGLLLLGPRLSDDPYSGEDKQLLTSVAVQAGITLEGIRLAEQMADRLEVERRAEHEMDLARQVQTKLLPQRPPALVTLECAACCVQARAVGGDYYDFLELGAGRVGLALADISGKGFPAALLTASLQASLRSRSSQDMLDLPRQLRSVNQLLFRSSESNRFATLFLGIYDDASRRLLYANCGHNPPVVLRSGGSVERLSPTAPVLGLFEEWECHSCELRLERGDLLAIFSDGITEAFDGAGEEFGDDRFIDALRCHREVPPAMLVDAVISLVSDFSTGEQQDDQTLIVARVR